MKSISKTQVFVGALIFCMVGAFAQEAEPSNAVAEQEAVAVEETVQEAAATESIAEAAESYEEGLADNDSYEEAAAQDSAQETAAQQESDAYAEAESAKPKGDDYDELEAEEFRDKNSKIKPKKKKKKEFGSSGNFFKDFIFGKQKYIFYDEVELATGTLTFGVKPRVAQMIYNPKTEKVGVQVYYQTSYFNIVWAEKERKQILSAISLYLEDFENKRLIRDKNSKTRKIYGNGKCFEEWGTTKVMMTNFANTRIQYGYEFKKGSPYFCLIIKGAKNEQKDMGTYISQESTEIQIYFTRAKAKAFAAELSDERIMEQRQVYLNMMSEDEYEENDSYSEKATKKKPAANEGAYKEVE